MAYGVKYRIGSKEPFPKDSHTLYEVELLLKDYTGEATNLKSPANAFTFEYQGRDDDLGFAIKKGMLEARFYARNQAEEDILNEFYGADEDEWRAKLYINGEHKWTGKVATNLFDVSDGPYPKSCEVVAKDLSSVDGKKIGKSNFRYGNLIETIAGIINGSTASGTGLSLPIHTYIGWEHEDLPAATDILQDLYYASYTPSFGAAPDTPFQVRGDRGAYIYVDLWKALTQILKRFNLTLFQWDGKWIIYQPGYLARHSDSVRRYEYDADGDRVGTTTGINLEEDISDYLIKEPKGHERYRKALKSVGSTLNVDHYGSSERFDQSVKIDPALPTSYEEITVRIYVPDYSTRMSFSFDVIGDWGQAGNNSAIARYAMWFETDGGDRVWLENDFNTAWDFVLNSAEDPLEVDLDNPENKKTFKKSVEVETSGFSYLEDFQMQAGFYADLTIRLYGTSSAGTNAPTLYWENFEYSVIEDDVTTTAESITNFLEQSQTFSPEKDLGEIIIGQHPYQNSDGNLMREAGGGRQIVAGYRPDGSDGIEDMERATLREVISLHRTYRKEYNFVGLGTLDLFRVYSFRGTKYIMTGGMLRSRLSEWDLTFVELKWEGGSDDFYQNYDSSEGPRSSGVVAGSSESGSGVSQNAGDNRWLNESNNLADLPDIEVARENLDVYSKSEADGAFLSEQEGDGRYLNESSNLSDLTDISAARASLGLGTGDSPTFAGQTLNGDLHVNGNIFQEGDPYETHLEQLYTEKDFIISRDGAQGGLAAGDISGLQVNLADGANDVVMGVDSEAIARVGWQGDTLQAILTREDSPTAGGIHYWDEGNSRSTTSSDLMFDGTQLAAPEIYVRDYIRFNRYGRGSFIDDSHDPHIYGTNTPDGSDYPFTSLGNLVIQPRTSSGMDVVIYNSDGINSVFKDDSLIIKNGDEHEGYTLNVNGTANFKDTLTGVDASFSDDLYTDTNVIIGEDPLAPADSSYSRDYLPNMHMGWLPGLPQYDKDGNPTGETYSSNQYGIWLRPGDDIVVDGEYRQKGGSWLLEEDAAVRILSGTTGNDILRLGRQSTLGRGLFFYDGDGDANENVILQLVNDKFEVRKDFRIGSDNGDYWEFGEGFQFGGSDGIMKGLSTYQGVDVSGKNVVGSNTQIFGDLDVSSLPRVSDEGLVGLWRFDEGSGNTAVDSVGGNDGTIYGATYTAGVSGSGLSFGGTDSVIATGIDIPDKITISYFVRKLSSSQQYSAEVSFGGIHYIRLDGQIEFRVETDTDGDSGNTYFGAYEYDRLYHIVATYDGSKMEVFVDGESRGTESHSGDLTKGFDLYIGSRNSNNYYVEGLIDEVRIYNRALSHSEIKSLYLNPSGNAGGRISANQVVATEGFFQELWAHDADVEGKLSVGTAHYIDGSGGSAHDVSFAGDVFTVDETEVGLAGFTANSNWLTDGQTYIGEAMWDNLGEVERLNKLYIGDPFSEGSGSIQARGDVSGTYATMRAPRDNSDYMFRANYQGDTLFQVGLGDNFIAGMEFNHQRMTNANGDFEVGENGFGVQSNPSYMATRAYKVLAGSTEVFRLYGDDNNNHITLDAREGYTNRIRAWDTGDIELTPGVNGQTYAIGDLDVTGTLSTSSKSFKIPHPNPEVNGYDLWHSTVESPTGGENLYRYTVSIEEDGGSECIKLPDYFKYLNKDIDIHVSPVEHFGRAYGKVNANDLKVIANDAGTYKVLIIGTRKDPQAVEAWKGAVREAN